MRKQSPIHKKSQFEPITINNVAQYMGMSLSTLSRCGFVSQSYFYKVFKKYKGVTPQEYRENYRRMLMIV